MEITFKPLRDLILVEQIIQEDITSAGIILPANEERHFRGKVLKTGPGTKDRKPSIKEGDVVIFGQRSGIKVTLNSKDYLLLHEGDTYATL